MADDRRPFLLQNESANIYLEREDQLHQQVENDICSILRNDWIRLLLGLKSVIHLNILDGCELFNYRYYCDHCSRRCPKFVSISPFDRSLSFLFVSSSLSRCHRFPHSFLLDKDRCCRNLEHGTMEFHAQFPLPKCASSFQSNKCK